MHGLKPKTFNFIWFYKRTSFSPAGVKQQQNSCQVENIVNIYFLLMFFQTF
jgi:hypothetical protein